MAEDNKSYVTYGKEHGISETKAKEYWEDASKSVKDQTGKSKEDLTDQDFEHIFGVYKKIIDNATKKESFITTKDYIIENVVVKKGSNIILKESVISEKDVSSIANKNGISLTREVNNYTDKFGINTVTYENSNGKKLLNVSRDKHEAVVYMELSSRNLGGGYNTEEVLGEYPIKLKFSKGDKFKVKWPRWDNEIANCTISKIDLDGLGYDEVTYTYDIYIKSIASEGKIGFYDIEDDADSLTEEELIKIKL